MRRRGGFRVTGIREMGEALKEFPKATRKNIVRRTLIDAVQPMADLAAAKAPYLFGDLRLSISASPRLAKGLRADKPQRVPGSGQFRTAKSSLVVVYVGPGRHPQGVIKEFGREGDPATPFLRPAFRAEARASLERITVSFRKNLDAAAARAERKAMRAARKAARGG